MRSAIAGLCGLVWIWASCPSAGAWNDDAERCADNVGHRLEDVQAPVIEVCTRALESPDLVARERAYTLVNRGAAHAVLGSWAHAFADFDRAVEVDPEYVQALLRRGHALLQLKEEERARLDFAAALRLQPDSAARFKDRGVRLLDLDQAKLAAIELSIAIAVDPGLATAYARRGAARMKLGEEERARADFEQALVLAPDEGELWALRGAAYWQAGRRQQALADLDQAVRLDPDEPKHLAWRGYLRQSLGDPDGARNDFDQALALGLDPDTRTWMEQHTSASVAPPFTGSILGALIGWAVLGTGGLVLLLNSWRAGPPHGFAWRAAALKAVEAYLLVLGRAHLNLRFGTLLIIPFVLLSPFQDLDRPEFFERWYFELFGSTLFLLLASVAVLLPMRWHRYVLLGEVPQRWFDVTIEGEFAYGWRLIAGLALVAAAAFSVSPLAGAADQPVSGFGGALQALAAAVVAGPLFAAFGLVLPARATDQTLSIADAWRLARPFWPPFAAMISLVVLPCAAIIVGLFAFSPDPTQPLAWYLRGVALSLAFLVLPTVLAVALSFNYRTVRPAPAVSALATT